MLNMKFVFLGGTIAFAGCLVYAKDTLRGVAKPNQVSWLLWTIATFLITIAEIRQHVGLQWTMSLAISFGELIVFAASFISRNGVWRLEWFDFACGVASAFGLVVWALTANNTVALAAFIIADALACIPTLAKSWKAPQSETLSTYTAAEASALITLAIVKVWSSGTVAFPLWIAAVNLVFILLIGTRVGMRFRRDPRTA